MARYDESELAEAKKTIGAFWGIAWKGLIVLVGVYLFFSGWYTVGAGERAIVLSWGAVSGVSEPGLHFKVPFVQTIERVDVRTASYEWAGKSAMATYSHDQQPAHLDVKVTYRVLPDEKSVIQLYSEYKDRDGFGSAVLIPQAYKAVKTAFSQYTAVTAIQNRAKLNVDTEAMVRESVKGPIEIVAVQIQNIDYSDEYEQAVGRHMKALVAVQEKTNQLEQAKKDAEIKVVQATAEAQRVTLAGEAQASAINARGKALRDNPELVALTAAEKWDGHLPTTMIPGGATPFINVNKQ